MEDFYTIQEQEEFEKILEEFAREFPNDISLLREDIDYSIFSEAITGGSVKRAVQYNSAKVRRNRKKVEKAIDNTVDAVQTGGKREEIKSIREDLMRGRAKPSVILKRALKCGVAACALAGGTGLTPVLALIGFIFSTARRKHLSKKERDQMIWEMEEELKILDEKIDDAKSDGDKKKKYQYMRLKSELERRIKELKYQGKIDTRFDENKLSK